MVDIHQEGRDGRAHAPNRRGRGLGLGPQRGEGAPHWEECAHQVPGCLSRSGEEGTKRRRSRVHAFVEHPRAGTARSAGHSPYRAAGRLSSVDGESSSSPSPKSNGTSNLNKSPPPPACVRAGIRH